MSSVARITLHNVHLSYPIYSPSNRLLRNRLLSFLLPFRKHLDPAMKPIQALRGIDLMLYAGNDYALIGKNGAGKSTLLNILNGVYQPSAGTIQRCFQHCTLLTPHSSINRGLSGLELILLYGMLLGETHTTMKHKIDEIALFAELSDSIHRPLHTFSTGMITRLLFTISISLQQDILLIDEALGSGDLAFMHKAKQRLRALAAQVMVISTHDLDVAHQLCNRGIWLEDGTVIAQGDINEVLKAYTKKYNHRMPALQSEDE